jgi:hypothetical protein
LLFDPKVMWTWLTLPQKVREDLEDRCDAVAFARPWDLSGVRQRLTQHDQMDSTEVCHRILSCTGGYPWLLDVLFDRAGKSLDPRPDAERLLTDLETPESPLRHEFARSLGLDRKSSAWHVLSLIRREKEVPLDLISPQLFTGDLTLAQEECDAAVEYLQHLGCVIVRDDALRVEGVVERVLPEP